MDADAGVVDQYIDAEAPLADLAVQGLGSVRGCQIQSDDRRLGLVVALELLRQALQPVRAAGNQHRMTTALGELAGEIDAQAAGRSGHDSPTAADRLIAHLRHSWVKKASRG